MNFADHSFLKLLVAGTAFWMALFLTPRAWVEEAREPSLTEQHPIRILESTQDCLWCDHPEASDCPDRDDLDNRIWLHPDSPPPSREAPCPQDSGDHPNA